MGTMSGSLSRRDFMRTAAATGATLTVLGATARGQGKIFKIGLVGCGGRGMGAVATTIAAGQSLQVEVKMAAAADYFKEPVELAAQRYEIAKDRCFVGPDAYKKLCESDVDLVLLGAPPVFRPPHLEAAVKAGKHIFMEKPVAVDPPGCRKVYATGEKATEKKLCVVAGTCLRHSPGYAATRKVVAEDGAIGKLLGGAIYYCVGQLWRNPRKEGWSDAEYLVRNWVNFTAMSGDHIVEQYVHTLDMLDWHVGAHPVATAGFGGRARRKTGDQFDFFSVDLEYPDGIHIHSMCRQVNGCYSNVSEYLVGEKGTTNCGGGVNPGVPLPEVPGHGNPYVQEHVDLLNAILKGEPLNETQNVAEATLGAVMSRISTYTGQRVTWDEMMKSDFACKPSAEDFEKGEAKAPPDDVAAIPGKD